MIRHITTSILVLAFAFGVASTASAQTATAIKSNSTSTAATSIKGNATSTEAKQKDMATSTATSTKNKEANATSTAAKAKENATSTAAKVKGESNGADHRSVVASFVKTLLASADRLGGIGQEVRVIANEQASSSEKVSAALDKVSKRSGFITFLIGSDYKTLGEIRSEIGGTEARIAKLQKELEAVAGTSEEAAIQAEITALEAEIADVKTFVDSNESTFSLFGWMRN